MSNDTTAATSPAAAPSANEGVAQQSGNLSVEQATLQLLKRGVPESQLTPSAEQATKPETDATAKSPVPDEGQPPPDSSTEEVSTETPAEIPADAKEEKVLSHEPPEFPPELQEKIDKRVGKEVARRAAAEKEVARLREEIARATQTQVTPQQQAPTPDDPLGHISDVQTLSQEFQNVKEVKRWAQAQLLRENDGEQIEAYGKVWSRSDLQNTVLNADRLLEDQIPARHNFIQARARAEQAAREQFPWMNNPESPEMADYKAAFQQYPFLAKLPDAPMVVAVQLAGQKYLKAQQQEAAATKDKKKAPKPSSPPPGSQTAVGAATGETRETAQTTAAKAADVATQSAKQKGNLSQKDLAKLLSQRAASNR